MKLFRSHTDALASELRHGAVTIGNFDGVHLGHAEIIRRLIARAREVSGPATVFTFDPHPVRLLRPELAPPPLTWTDRKAALLAELGVDAIIAYPTDESLLALGPEDFFRQVIVERLGARAMIEGPNFFFGRGRAGTIDVLRDLCRRYDVLLEVVAPLRRGRELISSSRIRGMIQAGDVAGARCLLTRPYRIRGMVTHGAARGAKIGFPTANLDAIDTLLPAHGVYAGLAESGGTVHAAAINIGPSPTFGVEAARVEVHLIEYEGSLYGEPLEVDFLDRLRDIQAFGSPEQLQEQLQRDVRAARDATEGML